jgi:ketosteroid isomerase-like protein
MHQTMETTHHGTVEVMPRPIIEQIRRALESNDLEAIADLYTEDATLEELSSLSPPAHPTVVHGREAILQHLRDEILRDPVSGWSRHVAHTEVIDELETDDAVAFTEIRTYAAGDKVLAQHLAHKHDGKITHDRLVVAWDAD